FNLRDYDCIIDCIDSLKDKITLILNATATDAVFLSSMGSALKTDPTKIRVAEFWKVRGCPLGSMLRKRIRQKGIMPAKDFLCVYDEEVLQNKGVAPDPELDPGLFKKAAINGTIAHITGIFGLTLAGLAINTLIS
ncbi:MAG: tRNA threonylcarbamoyladenosine dehydratase, partial [Bacteroidales bacterium]|nr:tRNA threonylcarbamoyladenosine dehydratase [Bacteroidales bacterium]